MAESHLIVNEPEGSKSKFAHVLNGIYRVYYIYLDSMASIEYTL